MEANAKVDRGKGKREEKLPAASAASAKPVAKKKGRKVKPKGMFPLRCAFV